MPLIAQAPTNRIILGLMTFGPDEKAGGRITDVNEFGKVLDIFQSRGYNEVDTARVYIDKKQEAFTREAKWKERGLTLATKIQYPGQPGMNQHDKVIESFETSLKELGTDCVDLVYLHAAVSVAASAHPLSTLLTQVGPFNPLRRNPLGPRQAPQSRQVRQLGHQQLYCL